MAKKTPSTTSGVRPPTRLVLVTPMGVGVAFAPVLSRALAGADVASVIVWTAGGDDRGTVETLRPLVATAQAAGAAALVRGETLLVGRTGADGLHCDGTRDDLAAAIADLSPERIVGAGNLRSRHDAMEAGESGADYVFFGHPFAPDGRGNARDLLLERAAWWQEIFEIPCIVYAPTLSDVAPLAMAGADFVALGEAVWSAPEGVESAMRLAAEAVRMKSREGAA